MLADRYYEPGAGLAEKLRPLPGLESLGRERVNQILVPEGLLIPVDLAVMLVL